MKQEAILLNRPEDYKRLGINPDQVELWEDGVRDTSAPNHFEWWYFDSILDNGTKVVIQFLSKNGRTFASDKYHPTIFFKVTLPDGRQIDKEYHLKADEIRWDKNTCNVQFGPHFFKGDLQHYQIHMQLQDGMAADLTLCSTGKPYRPGTSYFQFGSEDKYYTWLCVVPRGKVTGSLTVDGQARNVSGSGYHDHQWGSINFHRYWNHWIWARQGFDDYSMLLFDFFTNEEYGYQRFPIIFIQDEHGSLVFENCDKVKCLVKQHYTDDASGKEYPSELCYEFEKDGTKVVYRLEAGKTLEKKGMKNVPLAMRLAMKAMKLQASYSRYAANGELSMQADGVNIERKGALIYEIMCPGMQCVEFMDTERGITQ